MNIESKPLHCTLVFEVSVGDKKFNAIFYQDIEMNDKVVNVLNLDGTPLEDSALSDSITKHVSERYDITYDPGSDEKVSDPLPIIY